jgi:hypothetical protein
MIDFVSPSLTKGPKARAIAETLMKHPWVVQSREKVASIPLLPSITTCEEGRARKVE